MNINRIELEQLSNAGYSFDQPWQVVDIFEKKIAGFFRSPYAIAVDSCSHALELSLRLLDKKDALISVPLHTYMSVPMTLEKINQPWQFKSIPWTGYYYLDPLPVIDAAFLWQRNSYIEKTLTCISFQFKKHLPIGRGGVILTDDVEYYHRLQRMCRDGRDRSLLQTDDDIKEIGYHYHMVPEDAARGIMLFDQLHDQPSKIKGWQDYKCLTDYSVFKSKMIQST